MNGKENIMNSATYLVNKTNAENGEKAFDSFWEETKDAMSNTTKLLMKIINDNKDTEYGRKYHFADIHTIEDYQKMVPVAAYDDFAPYIEKMMNGEQNILTAYHCGHMNETSGTIGTPKTIPMTDEQSDVFARYNNLCLYGLMKKSMNEDWMNGRAFCTSSGNCRTLESGITVGEASAKMADYIKGGKAALDQMIRTIYTSPLEGLNPVPKSDSKYIHTRFALMDREVRGIITGFYSVAVLYLTYIADNYEMLIEDIEKGTINEKLNIDAETRESLLSKISPMPERAAELREIFSEGADKPFVKKIWPNFCYIYGVGADGFSVYDDVLSERFFGEKVNRFYGGITASEGLWSIPVEMNNSDSAIVPGAAFIEFLPIEAGDDFSKCVTLDKVEEGKIYELIITNLSGFYRYRMSDAVMISGFYNKTPLVQFMYRVNRTINLAEEKTTEKALQIAVQNATKDLGIPLSDFTVYPDVTATPNRYIFLIEPRIDITKFDMEKLQQTVFTRLCEANPVYLDCYEDKWLDIPKVYFLQPETSLLYRDLMAMKGASVNQLKPVRVIMNEIQRKFFFQFIQETENKTNI